MTDTAPQDAHQRAGATADYGPLRSEIDGAVLTPGDAGYDDARAVWNGRFDSRPAAIARCAGPDDVAAAVRFARGHGLGVGVKAGGHDYAGKSAVEGGLLIDLSSLDGVDVDADARTARVEAGATWGDFDAAAQRHGLATTGPTVSTVGVAGATLGGGSGWLLRKHGLSLDNLRAAEMVAADGRVVRASADEHPDLFWALRGGGGNLGVVTAFEFQLHEVGPELLAGQVIHRLDRAPEVLRAYRAYMEEAPDEVMAYAFFLRLPPIEGFLEAYHGQVVLDLVVSYAGPVEEGQAALRPLRELGDPLADTTEPVAYTALQQSFDAGLPEGQRYFSKAHYLDGLDDALIDTLVDRAAGLQGAFTMAYLEPVTGAAGRVDADATAFPHRRAAYSFHVLAGWTEPDADDELMDWTRAWHDAVAPYANGGVYVNLLSGEGDRVPAAYGPNYERLARLKAEWDPDNVFRANHNVPPAGSGG